MKLAHNVNLRVFSYEGEDEKSIADALAKLCPFDLAQEKLKVTRSVATSFHNRKISILEIGLFKEKHTSKFLARLKDLLSEDQRILLSRQAESRLDAEYNFFIRIDKEKLLDEDRIWITDSGNCFHVRMTVAAYPTTRENALKVVKTWLGQEG